MDLSDEDMNTILSHTKRIKEFLQNEIPELFQEPLKTENDNGEEEFAEEEVSIELRELNELRRR